MSPALDTFIHLTLASFVALFPVVNPIGTAFVVMPYMAHLDDAGKRRAVLKIALYAFCVCIVALLAGQWILKLFGLSVPVVQLAGGIMICKIGWEFLSSDKDEDGDDEDAQATTPASVNGAALPPVHPRSIDDKLFYPITFPVTTGAGTISVLFTLSAHGSADNLAHYLANTGAIVLAITLICVLVFVFYLNTRRIVHFLGSQGERIFNRVIAFFIFCVGLQIAVDGLSALFPGWH